MKILTHNAILKCGHETGLVGIVPSQHLVSISGRKVLVYNDPEARPIVGCTNVGMSILPCTTTLPVEKGGYSDMLRIDGKKVCLDTVTGKTVGTPPSNTYSVSNPGQTLVTEV